MSKFDLSPDSAFGVAAMTFVIIMFIGTHILLFMKLAGVEL